MGDAAAGYAQRSRAAARVRGLRSLVCACASLSRGPRGDSRAAPRSPRHQGRQHMHPLCAGEFRSRRIGRPPARHVHPSCADRLRVLSRVAREPRHAVADWLAEGLRLPVAAPPHRARVRPRRQPSAYAGARLALRPLQPGRHASALPSRRSTSCHRRRGKDLDRKAIRRRPSVDLPAAQMSRR